MNWLLWGTKLLTIFSLTQALFDGHVTRADLGDYTDIARVYYSKGDLPWEAKRLEAVEVAMKRLNVSRESCDPEVLKHEEYAEYMFKDKTMQKYRSQLARCLPKDLRGGGHCGLRGADPFHTNRVSTCGLTSTRYLQQGGSATSTAYV